MLIKEKLSMMENCTASEKNIINFFIENVDTLNNASTRSLSKILFCSPSSIVRFCQKLGFTGFEDFKKQYLDEMKYLQSNFHNINPNIPFDYNDNNQKIAHKIAALYKEVVDDCLSLTNHDNLQKSVRLMQTNEDIYIIASSSQIGIAYSFQDKMSKIGKHVSVFTHTDYSYYESHYVKLGKQKDVLG
jgi:DNA-binding MurR/RpiR family transcriptional regulator